MIALGWIFIIAGFVFPLFFLLGIILLIIGYFARSPQVINIYHGEKQESVDHDDFTLLGFITPNFIKNVFYIIIIVACSYGMIHAGMSNGDDTKLHEHLQKQEQLNAAVGECQRKGGDCSAQYAEQLLEQYQYDQSKVK